MIKDVIISNSNYIVVDNFLESDKFFEIRNLYDNTSLHNSNTYFNKNLYSQKSWPYIDEDVVVDNVFTSDGWKYDDIYNEDYPQCIRHFQEELITFLDVPNTTYIVSKFHEMKNNSSKPDDFKGLIIVDRSGNQMEYEIRNLPTHYQLSQKRIYQ